MATITRFDPSAHRKLAASQIEQVFESKIFYVFRGRNAWHSTWVTHYMDGCMNVSLHTAKSRAEQLRERGSTFVIRELPALALRTPVGLLLVTEINTSTPLLPWISGHRRKASGFQLNQGICRLEPHLQLNSTVRGFVSALIEAEAFPRFLPGRSKNLFSLCISDADAIIEDRRTRLRQWKSQSAGGNFYLGWSVEPSKQSGRAVRRVADALSHSLHHFGQK